MRYPFLLRGDSLFVLQTLPTDALDAMVTDPPAGIEFMGKEWDTFKRGRLTNYASQPGGKTSKRDKGRFAAPTISQRANRRCVRCGGYQWSGESSKCRCERPAWAVDTSTRDTFIAAMTAIYSECLRVLKPGAHAVVWALPRTSHWTAIALEDAGFEVRDVVTHHFGTGFPKSMDVSKAIDRQRFDRAEVLEVTTWIRATRDAAGVTNDDINDAFGFAGMASHWTTQKSQPTVPTLEQVPRLLRVLDVDEPPARIQHLLLELNGRKGQPGDAWFQREKVGSRVMKDTRVIRPGLPGQSAVEDREVDLTRPASAAARTWEGWGTALKPASEHWILARKPLPSTVAACVLEHGTGALNINACRVGTDGGTSSRGEPNYLNEVYGRGMGGLAVEPLGAGRWPPNLVLSHLLECAGPNGCVPWCPILELDQQGGWSRSPETVGRGPNRGTAAGFAPHVDGVQTHPCYGDEGGASRYFPRFLYQPKASTKERNQGLDPRSNKHPTVKSIELMRWLVRLVTPPGGKVLDPFMGSGSTGVACMAEDAEFVGIEREKDYHTIASARVRHARALRRLT